ncbi:MAG: iron-containing alcohol dehydrogenase [Rhodospirillales bacterium]|nr:MAG: iron-containing alcohol dehydrogenase [Rhodospirillales bacterium]
MTAALVGNWNYPTTVKFGAGRIAELPGHCRALGFKRPLLVTDPGLARLPMIPAAVEALRAAGIPTAVFSDLKPNPIAKNVADGLAVLRAGGHDGVIAWGGGSGLDTAKVIAFMAGQTRPMWDFEDIGDWWTRADPAGILPVIAVPTTAGTGSETGRAGVITDETTHTKKVIFHPLMMPAVVIADPELTVGLPAHLTAATGMDAFIHCLEAYCAPGYHPYAEGIAVEGMRLVKEFLPRAVADGKDIEARGHMLAASQMGSTAFQKGLGAIHSLSHPVGAVLDTHHGLTNAVAMPYVVAFNRPAIDAKIVRLARWMDLPRPSFDGFMEWTLDLRARLGIPPTLADIGMTEAHLDRFAGMAAVDPTAGGNPVKAGAPEMRKMYEAALHGRL